MKNDIKLELSAASFIEDQGLQYAYLISIFRYILQISAYSAIEATMTITSCPEQLNDLSRKMLQPSDGDFISVLDTCIPALRTVWPSCAQGWFDFRNTEWKKSGQTIAIDIVSSRNDRIGHGVFDQNTLNDGLSKLPTQLSDLLDILSDLVPNFSDEVETGKAILNTPLRSVPVEAVRKKDNQFILVRRIENRGSIWRIRGQILSHVNSSPVVIEISETCQLLSELRSTGNQLCARNIQIGKDVWRTSALLPLRQTQTFEGRAPEINSLMEWWSDSDSRACLIYGEGGIGKTTLTLEFLNDFLDMPPLTVEWRPELIFYYSAKLTRWGVSGLEQISGISANINEALRGLVRILEPRLSAEWHTEDSRSLISKTATLFGQAGLTRDSILIVLDNTETLARNVADEAGLNKILREISTKLGKLIVTSRRRETFEAAHIQVLPMPEDTGAKLLRSLGDAYSASAIQQAGDSRLRKLSRQFGGKPILLDAVIRHISHTNSSIEEGANTILSQERGDLGAFLFEDAWKRMESSYRDVFFTIGQLGGSVGEQLLTWGCAEFSCYAPSWLTAFEETRFGSLIDYGASFDITLDSGAREFLSSKYSDLSKTDQHRITSAVGRVRKKHQQSVLASEEPISDRVLEAFRTNAAKAAKLAAARRDTEAAMKWFEEATVVDSSNAALFDRYAWYLMVNDQLDKAAAVAKKARALNPSDADVQFTYGMIAARRGEVSDADQALDSARSLGKMTHLVSLQKARARLEYAITLNPEKSADRRASLLEAIQLLDSSIPTNPKGKHEKHKREREKLLTRCHSLVATVTERSVLTKISQPKS